MVTIPSVLQECLREYMSRFYDLRPTDCSPTARTSSIVRWSMAARPPMRKCIRIQDLQHSHASLLIEIGFFPLLIAERLGHERVQTTMEAYGHLYPNKQTEVARQLDVLML